MTSASEATIQAAASHLARGGLVAFPTETVYGLGANALDPVTVARIFEVKQRPAFDPFIVHLADWEQLATVAVAMPPVARALTEVFSSGPLTLVVPKADHLPSIVTSGLSTVAVRVPSDRVARRILELAAVPVAAPSANRFGHLSPTCADHVRASLGDEVDIIVDGGHTTWGVESTIVDVTGKHPVVLRHGAITVEELSEIVGDVDVRTNSSSTPSAPGQLDSHYAPARIPLRIVDGAPESGAYLAFSRQPVGEFAAVEVLSPTEDLREAAANLFGALHRLDASGASVIHAETVPDIGLGRAINDRLRRAASK